MAKQLAAYYKGKDLFLFRLKAISDEVAECLSVHEGYLFLDGISEISDETAKSLAKHNGKVFFKALRELSPITAKILLSGVAEIDIDIEKVAKGL